MERGGRREAHQQLYDKQVDKLTSHLRSANLPTRQAKLYRAAALRVLKRMTEAGLARLENNLTAYYFYPDLAGVTAAGGNENSLGFYRASNGSIHLDGGDADNSIHDTYAHEYTHALDGPNDEISGTQEWQDAWREEIVNGEGLGGEGADFPDEGLAYLGELILRGKRELARDECPKCLAVWEGLGL